MLNSPTPDPETLAIEPSDAGQRLDSLISQKLSTSRSQVQRWIEDGLVEVLPRPSRALKASSRLPEGSLVRVQVPAPEPLELEPEDLPVPILFQDADLAVINKPRGMPVHPSPGHPRGTLVHALLHHL